MSVEVKAARERSGYPPSLAVAENRRCQHFGALDGHFVAMGSLLTYHITHPHTVHTAHSRIILFPPPLIPLHSHFNTLIDLTITSLHFSSNFTLLLLPELLITSHFTSCVTSRTLGITSPRTLFHFVYHFNACANSPPTRLQFELYLTPWFTALYVHPTSCHFDYHFKAFFTSLLLPQFAPHRQLPSQSSAQAFITHSPHPLPSRTPLTHSPHALPSPTPHTYSAHHSPHALPSHPLPSHNPHTPLHCYHTPSHYPHCS